MAMQLSATTNFELRVRLARRETGLSPTVKNLLTFEGSASFVKCLCYFCLVSVLLLCVSCLLI